jgi:hypothetical protein
LHFSRLVAIAAAASATAAFYIQFISEPGAPNIFLSRLLCVSADYLILDAHCLTGFRIRMYALCLSLSMY